MDGALGIIQLIGDGEDRSQLDASQSVTGPERIACSESIVEGTISAVAEGRKRSEIRLTVDVGTRIKPERDTSDSVTFLTGSPRFDGVPRYEPGQHVFVIVQDPPRILAEVFRGEEARWERTETHGTCRRPSTRRARTSGATQSTTYRTTPEHDRLRNRRQPSSSSGS